MIRFSEETAELQDFCQFRTEIDLVEGQALYPFYLDIGLYFAELLGGTTTELMERAAKDAVLTQVSKQTVQVLNPQHALCHFVPVTFDVDHYSCVDVVVHSAIFDFKFRPVPLFLSKKEDVVRIEQLVPDTAHKLSTTSVAPERSPQDVFFPKLAENGRVSAKRLDWAYDTYLGTLSEMQACIRDRIQRFTTLSSHPAPDPKARLSFSPPVGGTEEDRPWIGGRPETRRFQGLARHYSGV